MTGKIRSCKAPPICNFMNAKLRDNFQELKANALLYYNKRRNREKVLNREQLEVLLFAKFNKVELKRIDE